MKSIKFLVLMVVTSYTTSTFAQHQHGAEASKTAEVSTTNIGTINAVVSSQINETLNAYYDLKNALVATDASKAGVEAKTFLTKLDAIDQLKMTVEQKKIFKPLNEKLSSNAEHINESKDIKHQRDHFGELSTNVLVLVKTFGSNQEDAFVQYCPMIKKSWLSDSKSVKNPYYGNKMLTCGKVTETINKK